ncbi:hypothetical protein JC2156_15700 [Weissella koreensis KCTC 3621]|nr:hypothetical protein JC2156_15700 [Weissella koreensis KCTC 3621]
MSKHINKNSGVIQSAPLLMELLNKLATTNLSLSNIPL